MPDPAPEGQADQRETETPVAESSQSRRPAAGSQKKGGLSAAEPKRQPLTVDDSKAIALYANFCRVTGTPEEVICDFALNAQPFATPTEPIAIEQRITLNYYTAKRMFSALSMTLDRHEKVFGRLETDVQKRVQRAASS